MKKTALGWFALAGIIVIPLIFGACGYRFAGSGKMPGQVKRLFVAILENKTSETGIGSLFTDDLIYEISRHQTASVTPRPEAEAILSGTIKSMRIETISRQKVLGAKERRVTIAVDLKLTSADGRTLWRAADVSANEKYNVAAAKLSTESNRRKAVETLSKRMAETIYNRLTENF